MARYSTLSAKAAHSRIVDLRKRILYSPFQLTDAFPENSPGISTFHAFSEEWPSVLLLLIAQTMSDFIHRNRILNKHGSWPGFWPHTRLLELSLPGVFLSLLTLSVFPAGLTSKPHHAQQDFPALRGSLWLRLPSTFSHRPAMLINYYRFDGWKLSIWNIIYSLKKRAAAPGACISWIIFHHSEQSRNYRPINRCLPQKSREKWFPLLHSPFCSLMPCHR